MFKVRYIALLVVALIVMACGGVGRSVEVHDVPQSRWYSAEEFYYENEDKQAVISIQPGGSKVIYYRTGTADGHVWQLEYNITSSGTCESIRWFFER